MDVPSPNDLVLVCLIPRVRDLEIARVLGWYRIPLKHAPKVIYTDFLAFYQPASFGKEHRWKIEYFAPVRGVELVRRRDLLHDELSHPRANNEYYKISVGDLQKLDEPISAGLWKRITFFYTSGGLLTSAETIADLVVRKENKIVFESIIREYQERYSDLPLQHDEKRILGKEYLNYFLMLSRKVFD